MTGDVCESVRGDNGQRLLSPVCSYLGRMKSPTVGVLCAHGCVRGCVRGLEKVYLRHTTANCRKIRVR